jgi:branched-chain amino acid transport system permease protein
MMMIFGIPAPLLFGQLLLGLINGAFYALLSLGLAIIFGMLNIVNFAHGALFMLGAFVAWGLLNPTGWMPATIDPFFWGEYVSFNIGFGGILFSSDTPFAFLKGRFAIPTFVEHWPQIGYWPALVIAPIIVGALGVWLEKRFISKLYKLDHLYGLLLTFGLALIIEGLVRNAYGSSGLPYRIPSELQGAQNLGFMILPNYRGWVVVAALVVCVATWLIIEKTSIGAKLRAATENAPLVQSFGINVPRMITLTYGAGVALAAFAGVLAAPIYSVNPNMGSSFIITVFAVVVIGGMGSILGSIVSGFGLGIVEGLTRVFYPQGSATVIFVVMVVVLLARPAGLFGRAH